MTKHSTKRSLMLAIMSLVLCVAMLAGTTFAWFTDSVTSANNVIKSGNLDMTFEYWDGAKWVDVQGESKIFAPDALWEPGYTEVVYFKVANVGSLAFKYQLGVNIASETGSVNVLGQAFKLSDYIYFDVVEGIDPATAPFTRDTAKAEMTNTTLISEGYSKASTLNAADPDLFEYVAMIVYMPETVGNDANYDPAAAAAPVINLGINAVATQYTVESDSFDNLYDKDATYTEAIVTSEAELKAAINAGKKMIAIDGAITLTSGFSMDGVTLIGFDDDAAIDFGTHGISGNNNVYKNLTLDNERDGWYKGLEYSDANNNTYEDCTFANGLTTYGNSTFKHCTFNQLPAGNYALFCYDGDTITVEDCTFVYGNRAIKIYSEGPRNVTVTINGANFVATDTSVASKAMIEIDDTFLTSVKVDVKNIIIDSRIAAQGVYRIDDGALDTSTAKSVVTVDGVSSASSVKVTNKTELTSALTGAGASGAGNTVITFSGEDINLTGETWTPVKVDGYHGADIITIDGNGATITGLTAPLFAGGFAGGSGIVIKNLTIANSVIDASTGFDATGVGAFICAADSMDVITLENCHLFNSTVKGSRTGGLVGWTSGYNVQSDGPVDTYVTIKNCSVIGCTIEGEGTVGAINGHAGANPATFTTIENCIVKDNVLTSYDDSYRVGVVLGTANIGHVTINNITASGNTLKQINGTDEIDRPAGQSDLYGRFVPNSTGTLTIDGVAIN